MDLDADPDLAEALRLSLETATADVECRDARVHQEWRQNVADLDEGCEDRQVQSL